MFTPTMAPMFGFPNYDFNNEKDSREIASKIESDTGQTGFAEIAFWYTLVLIGMLLLWLMLFFCLRIIALRQKTRNPQQRRTYMGNVRRPSLTQAEPTIYVSPANLPPPPKYEAMAPPSYEEVVGIHYPGYRPPVQPITQPITTAMAQSAAAANSSHSSNSNSETVIPSPATVITVSADNTRTSVTVAT